MISFANIYRNAFKMIFWVHDTEWALFGVAFFLIAAAECRVINEH